MVEKLAQSTGVRAALVVGGLSLQVQASTLKTRPEIVVATPVSQSLHARQLPDVIGATLPALYEAVLTPVQALSNGFCR